MSWTFPCNTLSREENNWFSVEHVHNQLLAILKKGTDNLEVCDLAMVTIGENGNKAFVATSEQLLMVHEHINTKLGHRFKSTHPNGMEEDCYLCSFLKNQHEEFKTKYGWKGNALSLQDIQLPKYLLLP
jgi:hypothetical protein